MRFRVALSLVATAAFILALASSAQAAVTVANQNDSGPGSLREAVATAPGGELIILPAGTYTLASTLKIEKSLAIVGHGASDTTIRSGGEFRVIEILGNREVEFADVTIRDGKTTGGGAVGSGIFSVQASLTLRQSVVTNNVAESPGGGAQGAGIFMSVGSLELIESSVTNNLARANGASGAAGGTALAAGVFMVGQLTIQDSTISGNVAEARGGQGPSNSAQDGGIAEAAGIFAVTAFPGHSRISGSTFSGNVADASGGPGGDGGTALAGGVFVTASYPTTFVNSTIASNTARVSGPNGTGEAGGGFLTGAEPGLLSLLSSTVSGNSIEGASANSKGGNLLATQTNFRNTIVANGSGGVAGFENCYGGANVSLGFNLDSRDQCEFKAAGDKVNTDPQLGPLQSNGGPTQTMAPSGSSPAVDQGIGVRPLDQRGIARPIDFPSIANAPGGDGSDIGAVELQPASGLTLGKLVKNKKKGTGTLTVTLPTPSVGTLSLAGKGLKSQAVAIAGQGEVKLKVATKGGASKKLRKKGSLKVKLEVTYAPTANSPVTQSRSVKLVRKAKKHRHKR